MTLPKSFDFILPFATPSFPRPRPPQIGTTKKTPEYQMLHQSQYFLEASLADFFETY